MQVLFVDPAVFGSRVACPLDKVLLLSAIDALSNDLFNFIFFFSINKLRGWLRIVSAVFLCFMIRNKQVHMEHIMDSERFGELELICDR